MGRHGVENQTPWEASEREVSPKHDSQELNQIQEDSDLVWLTGA